MITRVLHVTEACRVAGTERALLMLLDHADRTQFEHVVVCRGRSGLAQEVEARGFRTVTIPRMGKLDPLALARFVNVLVCEKPDIVHIHGGRLEAAAAWALGVPVVERKNVDRNEFYRPLVPARWADRLLSRFVKASIVPARALVARYGARGCDTSRFHVIYNGVEPAPPRSARRLERLRQSLVTREGSFLVAFAGRLEPVKGVDVLLRAMAILPQRAACLIAGDGPHRAEYETLVDDLALGNRVRFLGYRRDIREIFAAADVVAVPSLAEALANTTLEAMAEGKPVVTTGVAGQDEAIEHGVTGLIVPPQDASALAAAIGQLMDDPAQACRMGAAGKRKAESLHCPQRMVRQTEAVYREVLAIQNTERKYNAADCRQEAI